MFQGQIGEIAPLSPGNWAFSHFSPIVPPIPPTNWVLPPSKKLLFRIDMEKGYPLKKFRLDKLKITVSISNCKNTVSNIFQYFI